MKRIASWMVLFFLIFSLRPLAQAEERVIKLKDGSVIPGEILSKEGDIYKIKTATLGIVAVQEEKISSIAEAEPKGTASVSGEEKAYREKILASPQAMESVKTLAQDKDVVAILSDPQLKEAIARHDLRFLQTNEKFIKFMNNPAVKKIVDDMVVIQQKDTAGQ
jgi:hypothetical protein